MDRATAIRHLVLQSCWYPWAPGCRDAQINLSAEEWYECNPELQSLLEQQGTTAWRWWRRSTRGNPLPGGYPREQQRECLCLPLREYSLACSCSDGLKGSGNRVRRCWWHTQHCYIGMGSQRCQASPQCHKHFCRAIPGHFISNQCLLSLWPRGRLAEQIFVPAVLVSPATIPVSHLEQLQGHLSLLEHDSGGVPWGCGASGFACVTNTTLQKCCQSNASSFPDIYYLCLHFPHVRQWKSIQSGLLLLGAAASFSPFYLQSTVSYTGGKIYFSVDSCPHCDFTWTLQRPFLTSKEEK